MVLTNESIPSDPAPVDDSVERNNTKEPFRYERHDLVGVWVSISMRLFELHDGNLENLSVVDVLGQIFLGGRARK